MELPERGQPLDISYLSRLAQAINDVQTSIGSTGAFSSVKTSGGAAGDPTGSVKTYSLRFYTATRDITFSTSTATSQTADFGFSGFNGVPVVIPSVESFTGNDNLSCVVKALTPTGCQIKVTATGSSTEVITARVSILVVGTTP
jgi:hypothetical protein